MTVMHCPCVEGVTGYLLQLNKVWEQFQVIVLAPILYDMAIGLAIRSLTGESGSIDRKVISYANDSALWLIVCLVGWQYCNNCWGYVLSYDMARWLWMMNLNLCGRK
jgi:hypothetical protein